MWLEEHVLKLGCLLLKVDNDSMINSYPYVHAGEAHYMVDV